MLRMLFFSFYLVACWLPVAGVAAQDWKNESLANFTSELDDQRVDTLMAFATEHQPGVARLLKVLKQQNPRQYDRAIASLDREVRRLETLKSRDATAYDLGLRRWKNRSATELLRARVALVINGRGRSNAPAPDVLVRQLRQLFVEREALKVEQLEMELARVRARASRIEQQIEETKANAGSVVDTLIKDITKRSNRSSSDNQQ